jgi:hypothetical protein
MPLARRASSEAGAAAAACRVAVGERKAAAILSPFLAAAAEPGGVCSFPSCFAGDNGGTGSTGQPGAGRALRWPNDGLLPMPGLLPEC